MQAEKFMKEARENSNLDCGICPPSTKAQDGLHILIEHFLGEDWYVVSPLHTEQVNTEAIYQILKLHPTIRDRKEKFKEKLIGLINKL